MEITSFKKKNWCFPSFWYTKFKKCCLSRLQMTDIYMACDDPTLQFNDVKKYIYRLINRFVCLWPWSAWREKRNSGEWLGVTEDAFTADVPLCYRRWRRWDYWKNQSVITIQALTNSVVYCNIYSTTHHFFLKRIFSSKFETRPN